LDWWDNASPAHLVLVMAPLAKSDLN
jgi:hypothetical protein